MPKEALSSPQEDACYYKRKRYDTRGCTMIDFYMSDNAVTNVWDTRQFSKVNTADNTVINVWVLETEITFFIADIFWHL